LFYVKHAFVHGCIAGAGMCRSPFLWDITLCHWVIGAQFFKMVLWAHLQGLSETSRLYCPEELDTNHPMTWHHTSLEQACQLHHCESLKTCKFVGFVRKVWQPEIWHHSVTLIFSSDFDADWENDNSDLSKCDNLIGVQWDSMCAILLMVGKFLFCPRHWTKSIQSLLSSNICFVFWIANIYAVGDLSMQFFAQMSWQL